MNWQEQCERYGVEPGRCPHIIRKRAGDESYDDCKFLGIRCMIEHGHYECETWNEIQGEVNG